MCEARLPFGISTVNNLDDSPLKSKQQEEAGTPTANHHLEQLSKPSPGPTQAARRHQSALERQYTSGSAFTHHRTLIIQVHGQSQYQLLQGSQPGLHRKMFLCISLSHLLLQKMVRGHSSIVTMDTAKVTMVPSVLNPHLKS